jgi:type IV secretion system protein VirB10
VVTTEASSAPAAPALVRSTPPASTADASAAGQIVVPANTAIPLELRSQISTHTAYVGQTIYCDTIYPVTVNNRIILPVRTYVKGEVTQVTRPGKVKGKAELGLKFDEITLPNGVTKPLRATLSGFGGNGKEGFSAKEGRIEGESTKGQDAKTIAIPAATGASIGAIAGHDGLGAGIGGAVGAAGGLTAVLLTRGKEVVLPRGTSLELQLSAPLSFYKDEIVESPTNSLEGPELGPRDPGPGL